MIFGGSFLSLPEGDFKHGPLLFQEDWKSQPSTANPKTSPGPIPSGPIALRRSAIRGPVRISSPSTTSSTFRLHTVRRRTSAPQNATEKERNPKLGAAVATRRGAEAAKSLKGWITQHWRPWEQMTTKELVYREEGFFGFCLIPASHSKTFHWVKREVMRVTFSRLSAKITKVDARVYGQTWRWEKKTFNTFVSEQIVDGEWNLDFKLQFPSWDDFMLTGTALEAQ